MASAQITLIICFLLFFFLTRTVYVRIIKEKAFVFELHLPLFAICIEKRKSEKKKKRGGKIGARTYIKICARTISHIKKCRVEIKSIRLPLKTDSFSSFSLVRPFGYQGIIYTIFAYLKTKADRLVLYDNAVISSPDIDEIHFYLTVKLRLFQLIYALLTIRREIVKENAKG